MVRLPPCLVRTDTRRSPCSQATSRPSAVERQTVCSRARGRSRCCRCSRRGCSQRRMPSSSLQLEDRVAGDVGEEQVVAVLDPHGAFGPGEARGEDFDLGVLRNQLVEPAVLTDDLADRLRRGGPLGLGRRAVRARAGKRPEKQGESARRARFGMGAVLSVRVTSGSVSGPMWVHGDRKREDDRKKIQCSVREIAASQDDPRRNASEIPR